MNLGDSSLSMLRVGESLEMRDLRQELGDYVERRVAVASRNDDAVKALKRAHTTDAVTIIKGDVRDADDAG